MMFALPLRTPMGCSTLFGLSEQGTLEQNLQLEVFV